MQYSLHQIFLEGLKRYYLPLPKLNDTQMRLIAARLKSTGFNVAFSGNIRAKMGARSIAVQRLGLAWSNVDLLDPLAPLIPALLAVKKTRVQENPYYMVRRKGDLINVQLFPRMESFVIWSELRRRGLSGLTPDEAAIVASLKGGPGRVLGVTDYPREGGRTVRFGRKVYFESMIETSEFIANLRTVEKERFANAYLPRNSMVEVQTDALPSNRRVKEVIDSLGEWCFVTLGSSKTSNCGGGGGRPAAPVV